jgi:hypothetical protein
VIDKPKITPSQQGANMDVQIKTADYEKLCISDYEQDIWISIWHMKAHAAIHLNKEQVTQLRDELNKYLEAV